MTVLQQQQEQQQTEDQGMTINLYHFSIGPKVGKGERERDWPSGRPHQKHTTGT